MTGDAGRNPLKVSVLVMTFNHRRFIEEALDSVLSQRTQFDWELLVSEDCSTDGTREVVIDYQRRSPGRIRLLLSERNLRSNAVVARGIAAARGQYIALLDGDDFWSCADKLQRQVEFMDAHPECSICFHNARVVHEDGSRPPWNWVPAGQRQLSTLEDLWMGNFIPTCSTMYRNGVVGTLPDWYSSFFVTPTLFITDWPLHVLHAERGLIGYLDEVMGTYRYHSGGLYSRHGEYEKLALTLEFYRKMNELTQHRYERVIAGAVSRYFLDWADEYQRRGETARAYECLRTCLKGSPFSRFVSFRHLMQTGTRVWLANLASRTGRGRNRIT
jgi:glycosyltransferase involved in cell wall biosynthesis